MATSDHWNGEYRRGEESRSWYQPDAGPSLRMLAKARIDPRASVIDVGGGTSSLVDELLASDYQDVTVLDVSPAALDVARHRLGERAAMASWIEADLLSWSPDRHYQVWHDRAVFHFMADADARATYRRALTAATAPGSVAVLATFAEDGPQSCSGLPTCRYSAAELAEQFAPDWVLLAAEREEHRTPGGVVQPFTWVALTRG